MYDPQDARFLQEDSYRGDINDPLSLNLYAHCNNNPLIYDDPTGHWPSLSNAWNTVKNFASNTANSIKSGVNTVIDVVKGIGVGIFDFGKNLITGTVDLIKAVPTMVKSIPKIVETITNPKKRTEFITENAPTIIMLSKPGAIEEAVGKSIINSVSESWNKEVTNGTAYTRSRYITEGILTIGSVFVGGTGGAKAASGLGKAGTASKALKFGKIANGLDKVEDTIAYYNKSDDILRESIIIGKSNKVSKGAEVIKTPFEIPAGGVAGDDMGAMLKGAAEAVEQNYVLFNKTHSGSAPVPKGTGPNGGRLQSHHGLQQQWAKENLSQHGYDPELAPTITIETGKGMPHTSISNAQNARRNARVANGNGKWSSSLQDELQYMVDDFTSAGFTKDTINGVLEQQYKMLDKLKAPYERIGIK